MCDSAVMRPGGRWASTRSIASRATVLKNRFDGESWYRCSAVVSDPSGKMSCSGLTSANEETLLEVCKSFFCYCC